MTFPKTLVIASFILLVVQTPSCNEAKNKIDNLATSLLKNYSINPTPSALDTVGLIFSIDTNGRITPVGALDLHASKGDSVAIPYEVDTSNISFGLLLNLLNIKNFDSTTNIKAVDTIRVITTFKVDQGTISRYDVNLPLSNLFNAKKDIIAGNVKFLGLQNDPLYLILETIKSNQVNLTNLKTAHLDFDAEVQLKKLIELNPNANAKPSSAGGVKFSSTDSRVIFYKLRQINVNIIEARGPGDTTRVDLSLGPLVKKSGLY
jgi:hypothetical protein